MNLCAQLQIDLARLQFFAATSPLAADTPLPPAIAVAVAERLDDVCERLQHVGIETTWVYPELLNALATTLERFPIATVLAAAGRPDDVAAVFVESIPVGLEHVHSTAAALKQGPGAGRTLLALARVIRAAVHVGAPQNDGVYEQVAALFPQSRRAPLQKQLCRWAENTADTRLSSDEALLDNLLLMCAALRPAESILRDLLERMRDLVYVPFVLPDAGLSVTVPVRVEAHLDTEADVPVFQLLPEGGPLPHGIEITQTFAAAVADARAAAGKALTSRGRKPDVQRFKVVVSLPDMRMADYPVKFDDSSIQLPITLAILCQHPSLKRRVALNPEKVPTGPTPLESASRKAASLAAVGVADTLIATSRERPGPGLSSSVRVSQPHDIDKVLRDYLTATDSDAFNRLQNRVFTVDSRYQWDLPLLLARRTHNPAPLLPMPENRRKLDRAFENGHAVQLRGMAGIGKTWLVAQWLEQAQHDHDLTIHLPLPSVMEVPLMDRWLSGAFDQLATSLCAWDCGELRRRLNADAGLVNSPRELVRAISDALAGRRVLWVIDDGQALLDDDNHLREPRLRALVDAVHTEADPGWRLLFVTNRHLLLPSPIPEIVLNEGFTFEEGLTYLDRAGWPFPALKEVVVRALGMHPRALALLVHHAIGFQIHSAQVTEILDSLPSLEGEVDLRAVVCRTILERIFREVRERTPLRWWALMLASVFLEPFEVSQFKRLLRAGVAPLTTAIDAFEELKHLDLQTLLYWSGTRWSMHSLVQGYAQDELKLHEHAYRAAHRTVGEDYFPLTRQGKRAFAVARPRGDVTRKYKDATGCAIALHHFDLAEFDDGQQAVLESWNQHVVTRAQWWMSFGQRDGNPVYGYQRAESLLRKVLQVYAADGRLDVALEEVPANINALMGEALRRQRRREKSHEAAAHLRQAIAKGWRHLSPALISVLCDVCAGSSETDASWNEAEQLFGEVSADLLRAAPTTRPYRALGEAYEKVARRYLEINRDDPTLAMLVIEEAAEKRVAWDRLYLLAASLEEQAGRLEQMEMWLQRGLELVPQSGSLWIKYVLRMSSSGRLGAVPVGLKRYPRGVRNAAEVANQLNASGFAVEALGLLEDSRHTYVDSEVLFRTEAIIAEANGDLATAEQSLRHACRANPENGANYSSLARLLLARERSDAAVAVLEQGCERQPSDGGLWAALGSLYERIGNKAHAERSYSTGVQRVPNFCVNHIALAQLLEARGAVDDAIAILERGCEGAPRYGRIWMMLGALLERLDRRAEAERMYQEGISNAPTFPTNYLHLARCREARGQIDSALGILVSGSERALDGEAVRAALAALQGRLAGSANVEPTTTET